MSTGIPHEVVNRLRRQLLITRRHQDRMNSADEATDADEAKRALRAQQLILNQIKGELKERYMTDEAIAELFERENSRTSSELQWLTAER
ncbi:hypothetical protein [Vreelandella sulfidaeris]